jgi:HK97 family phage prohead protease
MSVIIKTNKFDFKSLNTSGEIVGYASVFNYVDSHKDSIQKGAFVKSIKKHLSGDSIKLLWQHDQSQPIGCIVDIYEDSYGLFVKAKLLHEEIAKAKEAYALIKSQAINSFSVGFKIVDSFYDNEKRCRVITDLNLWEISFVTFPANSKAKITDVKSHDYHSLLSKIQQAINVLNAN